MLTGEHLIFKFFAFAFILFFSCSEILPTLGSQSLTCLYVYGTIGPRMSTQRPYIDGNKIMVNGSEFNPIGVIKECSIIYYSPNSPTPTNWVDETAGVYNLLDDPSTSERETRFNVVMLSENRWLWENDPNYIPALHNLVDMCEERGLYVIIRWGEWINEDYNDPEYGEYYMDLDEKVDIIIELNGWRNHVVSIAQEFKNQPTVIGIAPLNEPTPPHKGWTAKGYTTEEAHQIYRDNLIQVVDAIHAVSSEYIVFVSQLGTVTLDEEPLPRDNLVYCVHWYYGWDTEWDNAYADAYWNAETETDFQNAYEVMEQHYQTHLLDFRDQYNVPVMNTETSMCKLSYKTDSSCRNTERQFQDQICLGAEKGFGQLYYQMDRNRNNRYWGLLDADNAETWSSGGLVVKDAINRYYS